jgi:hypothetical protein
LAFHQDAFCLPDDIASAQCSVQRGFTPFQVGAVMIKPGSDGEVCGEHGAEVHHFGIECR